MMLINKYWRRQRTVCKWENEFVKMTEKLAINWYLQNKKRIQTIIHFKNIGDNNDTYKRVL